MMKNILASAFAFCLFAVSPLQAQTLSPDDPAAVAAVKELMRQTNYRQMIIQSNAQMEKLIPQMMLQAAEASLDGGKPLTPKERSAAVVEIKAKLPAAVAKILSVVNDPLLLDELEKATIPLYTKHFTVDEIKQLTAIYRTPLGKKMLERMPVLIGESMEISQRIVMPRVMKTLQEHFAAMK